MNKAEKIVFSNTHKTAEWNNTTIMKGDIVEQIISIKSREGKDLAILRSGSIVTQFSDAGLIDTYQIMIDPVALGGGTTLFEGLNQKLDLKLVDSRVFNSGVVLLIYEKME